MNMKKKLTISVADLLNKNQNQQPQTTKNLSNNSFHPSHQPHDNQYTHHLRDPLSFEDMYRQIMKKSNKGQATPKYVYESKKVTPMNTQRIKKGIINSVFANKSQKTNKTAAPRILNPKSGSSSTNQSWKNTPENKRKNSISSVIMNKENMKNNVEDPDFSEFKLRTTSVKNLKSKRFSVDDSKNPQRQQNILIIFDQFVKKQLQHQKHSHLRKDQCFLGEQQVYLILQKLGYDINHKLVKQMLELLEVDIYGGTPSLNLRKLISIIQGLKQQKVPGLKLETQLPKKIINNNLQLIVDEKEEEAIQKYFFSFRLTRTSNTKKTQNSTISKHTSFEKDKLMVKESNSGEKQNKFMHLPLAELMNNLNKSSGKKDMEELNQRQKEVNFQERSLGISRKLDEIEGMNLNTFRKKTESQGPLSAHSIQEQKLYSPNSVLSSGNKKIEDQQNKNEDIVALKNRLNQALQKSSNLASQLSDLAEQNENPWQFPSFNKYGSKPILSVDVNLGDGISEKIIVYEGETAKIVSDRLANKFTINEETKLKFEKMLEAHLSTMLWKIDEVSEEMLTDRDLD